MESYTDGQLVVGLIALMITVWIIANRWTVRGLHKKSCGFNALARAATGEPVQKENRELRSLVKRLEDRIRVLETIATDPAERTSRAIDALVLETEGTAR